MEKFGQTTSNINTTYQKTFVILSLQKWQPPELRVITKWYAHNKEDLQAL